MTVRAVALERLLRDLEQAAKTNLAPELPIDLLTPEEGTDEFNAGMLIIPEEVADYVYSARTTLMADHLLSFLESAVEMHNEGIRLTIMAQIDHAARTDDFTQLADETGTGVKKSVEALLKMLVRMDPEGAKDYLNALEDIRHTLIRRSPAMHVAESDESWKDLLPVPKNAKCSECGDPLAETPFLIVMGSIVSPGGRIIYGDGFMSSGDSASPPGRSLVRGIPVCLECLKAHLSSEIVLRMAKPVSGGTPGVPAPEEAVQGEDPQVGVGASEAEELDEPRWEVVHPRNATRGPEEGRSPE